jgi:hypothetical protein
MCACYLCYCMNIAFFSRFPPRSCMQITGGLQDFLDLMRNVRHGDDVSKMSGWRYPDRRVLLFEPNCLRSKATLTTSAGCYDSRKGRGAYVGQADFEQGLAKAVMTWVRTATFLYDKYSSFPLINNFWVYPPLPEIYWYLNKGVEQDVVPGLKLLKQTLMDESLLELQQKSMFTWYLCAGAWALMAAGLGLLTFILNKQKQQIDKAVLMIQMFPWEEVKEKRLLIKHFGVQGFGQQDDALADADDHKGEGEGAGSDCASE